MSDSATALAQANVERARQRVAQALLELDAAEREVEHQRVIASSPGLQKLQDVVESLRPKHRTAPSLALIHGGGEDAA